MTQYEASDLRALQGIPNAFISRDGRVWRDGKEKKPIKAKVGYLVFNFSINNKSNTRYLHRLLLEAFVGPCPPGCEVLHINGNRLDNRLENLRWGTRKENMADAVRHGTATVGSKNKQAKLTPHDVGFLKDMRDMGFRPAETARIFKVSTNTIARLFAGQSYKKEFA